MIRPKHARRGVLALLFLIVILPACGQAPPLVHDSPLLKGSWDPMVVRRPGPDAPAPKSEGSGDEKSATSPSSGDLRGTMVSEARALLDADGANRSYGPADLDGILDKALPSLSWSAGDGLDALVSKAKRAGGFHTTGSPKPGDIALFHNMVDANGNGRLDDWLAGCAVVVDTGRESFEAVGRSGNTARIFVVSPDGPARNEVNGEKINSFIRVPHRSDPEGTEYLAGQLYAGFIDIDALAAAS